MGSQLKEDEKNERIIRGLLKQPANRKCINCNSLGPQYVCITFWTFVCTNCGGIHREFTHRVKSVSMAKFTTQEVTSLQEGGNERAKEIYFKELDASIPVPDGSNVNRLRDFIKHVYVDKRYTDKGSSDKPLSLRMGDKQDPYGNRREDSYHGASQSPAYEGMHEHCYSDKASPGYVGGRSPGYDQDSQRRTDYGSSPARSGGVNDWKREDRFTNGRSAEDNSRSEGSSKPEGTGMSSPPAVRPVREILADSTVTLRVIEPPRESGGRVPGGFGQPMQGTTSSSCLNSSIGNPTELKKMVSLIDFETDPEPPQGTATSMQPQQPASNQPVASSDGDNWAHFDNAPGIKSSQTPSNANPMESILTQLSGGPAVPGVPAPSETVTSTTSVNSSKPVNLVDALFAPATPVAALVGSTATLSPGIPYAAAPNFATTLPSNNASHSSGSVTGNLSTVASGWASTMTANGGSGPFPNMQHPQQSLYPGPIQGASHNPVGQLDEDKSNRRKELPVDLFTAVYPSYPQPAQGWQEGFSPRMQYFMQYNPAQPMGNQMHTMPNQMQPMPNYMLPAKSPNPFGAGGLGLAARPIMVQFPSMAPLQGALPNMTYPVGMGMGMAPPSWMPPQPSTYQSFAPQMTSYGTTAMTPGTYMGQQLPGNLPMSRSQVGGINNEPASFSSFNPAPSNPNRSVNPFG